MLFYKPKDGKEMIVSTNGKTSRELSLTFDPMSTKMYPIFLVYVFSYPLVVVRIGDSEGIAMNYPRFNEVTRKETTVNKSKSMCEFPQMTTLMAVLLYLGWQGLLNLSIRC